MLGNTYCPLLSVLAPCAVVLYKYLTHFHSYSRSISHLISSHQVQYNDSEHATLSSTASTTSTTSGLASLQV